MSETKFSVQSLARWFFWIAAHFRGLSWPVADNTMLRTTVLALALVGTSAFASMGGREQYYFDRVSSFLVCEQVIQCLTRLDLDGLSRTVDMELGWWGLAAFKLPRTHAPIGGWAW